MQLSSFNYRIRLRSRINFLCRSRRTTSPSPKNFSLLRAHSFPAFYAHINCANRGTKKSGPRDELGGWKGGKLNSELLFRDTLYTYIHEAPKLSTSFFFLPFFLSIYLKIGFFPRSCPLRRALFSHPIFYFLEGNRRAKRKNLENQL
jgi:hypothetical protein